MPEHATPDPAAPGTASHGRVGAGRAGPATPGPVLLADIGGTHARFALADPGAARPLRDATIRQADVDAYPSLADAARAYLRELGTPVARGVFAVAGPVRDDEVRMTNHPWRIVRASLREALSLSALELVNDFAAQAMALRLLGPDDLAQLGGPAPADPGTHDATRLVMGPGTGLGAGALLQRDGRTLVQATEAGHIAFAPTNDEEAAILRRLSARYGRVSCERLLSGEGLTNLQGALADLHGWPAAACQATPAAITAAAARGERHALQVVTVFCEVLGAVAGDLVLALGAWDGVYLGGGILPHMQALLQASSFRRRFEDKGRYADAMARVPSALILHPQPGLLGAAAIAAATAAPGERQA